MKEKILLADDEESLSRAVGKILEYNNYEVDIVSNGKEAIEKTKNNIYDIIILDIMMPIMDGIEALKEMRKIGINTPIMLLTAKSLIDDKDNHNIIPMYISFLQEKFNVLGANIVIDNENGYILKNYYK